MRRKLFYYAAGLILWGLILNPFVHALQKDIVVDIKGPVIHIQGENVLLTEILKVFSKQTGISIHSSEALKKRVSCDIKAESLTAAIGKLITPYNHAIIYGASPQGIIEPRQIVIIGNSQYEQVGGDKKLHGGTTSPSPAGKDISTIVTPPETHLDHTAFATALKNREQILNQVSSATHKTGAQVWGLTLTDIKKKSFLYSIGFRKGDVVITVDGVPINKTIDIINALEKASELPSPNIIRIERLKKNKEGDTIYLALDQMR